MLRTALAVGLATAFLASPLAAAANTTLIYTGSDFTTVESDSGNTGNGTAYSPNPYSTSDSIEITVTLSTALGDDLSFSSVTPVSYSVTDGVDTITDATAYSSSFDFFTDDSGQITGWDIDLTLISNPTAVVISSTNLPDDGDGGDVIDHVTQDFCNPLNASGGGFGCGYPNSNNAVNFNTPGSWSVADAAVPEPAGAAILAMGAGVLVSLRRPRRRVTAC